MENREQGADAFREVEEAYDGAHGLIAEALGESYDQEKVDEIAAKVGGMDKVLGELEHFPEDPEERTRAIEAWYVSHEEDADAV